MLTLKQAKQKFIDSNPLGKLSVKELKELAEEKNCLVYGDKAQILQCLAQSETMLKLFRREA